MKTLTLALGALVALIVAAPAMATPTAAVALQCNENTSTVTATFTYTSNANGMTADQTMMVGPSISGSTFSFDAPGGTDTLSLHVPKGTHTATASTTVTDDNPNTDDPRAQASDSVDCEGYGPPPPCEVDCGPPPCANPPCNPPPDPYCESHPNAALCKHNPPPPGKCDELNPEDPDCLPHTGPVAARYEDDGLPLWPFALGSLALLGAAGWLIRKPKKDRA